MLRAFSIESYRPQSGARGHKNSCAFTNARSDLVFHWPVQAQENSGVLRAAPSGDSTPSFHRAKTPHSSKLTRSGAPPVGPMPGLSSGGCTAVRTGRASPGGTHACSGAGAFRRVAGIAPRRRGHGFEQRQSDGYLRLSTQTPCADPEPHCPGQYTRNDVVDQATTHAGQAAAGRG
jgi:hypothetical protein